ncbi:MAG: methyltransferase domain-containing protein, partial [Candidatus Acidiferrum sp.]
MTTEEKHRRVVQLFQAGSNAEALALIREVLGEEDNSERWNDWATLQYLAGHPEEAEAGYRIAFDMNRGNTQAALNLGVFLRSSGRNEEAVPYLELAERDGSSEEKKGAEQLLKSARRTEGAGPASAQQLEAYLRKFLSSDPNERSYFETHVRRYVATLGLLPDGARDKRLLELGAGFHHLTPALRKLKGYGEVRCNDIWEGASQQTRRMVSNDGEEEFPFVVDNFDVQTAPWPYADKSFDTVLCCEMLEHLHSDPMGLLEEINRVLKPEGVLLLTTPNLACGQAVESALRGESPYVYGRFERGGGATDRHNREYTAGEVERLADAAGFGVVVLRTMDSWWECRKEVLRTLAAQGFPVARRGDNTILLGRKQGAVRERYPEEFYQNIGTQAERRSVQSVEAGAHSSIETEYTPPRNILMIHEVLPHFDCSGSDARLMDVIREIRKQGHQLTYVARNGKDFDRYAPPLEELGVKVVADDPNRMRHIGDDRATSWSFRELLERGRFHAAILFHWYWSGISVPEDYLQEIRQFSSGTRILVLTDDRHGERERRMAMLSGSFSDLERGNDFEAREMEVYGQADLVLPITEADKRRFLELCPGLKTELLPMQAETLPTGPGHAERDGVLFLGNFENLANGDALQWMLETIWPLVIEEEPELTLFVAGNATPKDLEGQYPNVKCVGKVEQLAPLFAARRVFAAPIRYGT